MGKRIGNIWEKIMEERSYFSEVACTDSSWRQHPIPVMTMFSSSWCRDDIFLTGNLRLVFNSLKGWGQRALLESAISQLPSAQNS